jgi:DMSO/TMAO reductase YedYZ molybdopterin-dependent catalytic subunit
VEKEDSTADVTNPGRPRCTCVPLPPGQFEIDEFPRFGLTRFARRFPKEPRQVQLSVTGDVGESLTVSGELRDLPRVEQISDFHCVTTWSRRNLRWGGFRFSDFFSRIVAPRARPHPAATFVILRGQDGFATSLSLSDLLADTVLLADRLDGEPLTIAHGAPLRLIAPAHYGYKSAKHLKSVELWRDDRHFRAATPFGFMVHPRGRVAFEERGRGVPGWILRYLYRPLVRPTAQLFRRELDRNLGQNV